MATFPGLPPAAALTGAEILALSQAGKVHRATADELIALHTAKNVPHPQYDVTTNLLMHYTAAKHAV